ncbi:MAG: phosphatidate cytidylyltransferase [Pseudomonadota bacterium]
MLKQRILTALVLAPLVIWGILSLPTLWFGGLVGLFVTVGAWEWARLAGFESTLARIMFASLVGVLLVLMGMATALSEWNLLIAGAVIWWGYATWVVFGYDGAQNPARSIARLSVGLVLLLPAWLALVKLHGSAQGPMALLFLMVLIWGADSGAYFAGRAFGKHKLAPKVSPGKSWEGVAGALLLTLSVAIGGGVWLWQWQGMQVVMFVVLCVVTVALSIVGDLYESMAKRRVGIKDSGNILPGHGGVLDRIDSLTSAAPVFVLGYSWMAPL